MEVLIAWLLFICLTLVKGELFKDSSFEESDLSANWECPGCTMSRDSDHTEGRHSVRVDGRQGYWAGVTQTVPLQTHTRYYVTAHVKQLNTSPPGKLYQRYSIMVATHLNNGSYNYQTVADKFTVRRESGWTVISAYFHFMDKDFEGVTINPISDFKRVTIRVSGPDSGINYLVDDMTLTEIPEDKNWKSEADARIEQHRKSNIHFSVDVPGHVSYADLDIQVDLVKHGFPFGSQTSYEVMNSNPHYNDLFYYMFNWATVNDFYWHINPQPLHNPKYTSTMEAIKKLHDHGLSVRGHTIFYGATVKYVPDWVRPLSSDKVKQAVDERIQYIVRDTKGKIEQWDVNNELLHGQWFEQHTGDPFYTHKMFEELHKLDPSVKLFLNDNHVVSQGASTTAYLDQAREFKAASVGLYGLGVQCHFPDNQPPDPTLVKKRLDELSGAGLPIWVTEMDLVSRDENTRAEWYDMALRILFSHPAVEGIILWGFWDVHNWRGPDAALVNGPNYHVNAAGLRYINLIHQEWSTHVTHDVSSGKQFDVRGFHGDYRVIVKYHGNPIMQQTFTLGKQDKHVTINILKVNNHIMLTTTQSPLVYNQVVQHPVTHIDEEVEGHVTSASSNHLTCMTRYSGYSEVGDDKSASVTCPSGYVLTGCLGKIRNNADTRDGERIVVEGGQVKCEAYDASSTTAPVQAIARCCKLSGLSCDYLKSGPSAGVLNQRLETRCHHHQYATGCTAHNFFGFLDGSFPTQHSCLAQNENNHSGVESFAVCCSAPSLTCQVKISPPAGDKQGDHTSVSCDQGWVLVGCSAYSDDAKLGGADIHGSPEQCIAVNGAERLYGERGATAYATCCHVH